MVDQKDYPDSVALALYWYLQPGFYDGYSSEEQIPDWAKRNYELISKIQKRFSLNDLKRSDIGFDPTNDPSPMGDKNAKGYDWTTEFPERLSEAVIQGSLLSSPDEPPVVSQRSHRGCISLRWDTVV